MFTYQDDNAADTAADNAQDASDTGAAGALDAILPENAPDDLSGWAQFGVDFATEYGPKVVGVLVALFVGWIIARIFSGMTQKAMTRARIDLTLSRFAGKIVKWAILIIVVVACLGVFGLQMTTFAAVIAAAGLAVGLAFQGTLSNFAAGAMLLVFRPFKVGDFINAAGQAGTVFEIDLFTTSLDTPDNRRIIVPNSDIFGSTIENITHNPVRRVDVNVGVAYDADIDRTREVLDAAAASIDNTAPGKDNQVVLMDLGDSAIGWQVRVWSATPDYLGVKQALTRAIKMHLDNANLGIPFPQMDVHVFKDNAA